jgi:hypothetical protein
MHPGLQTMVSMVQSHGARAQMRGMAASGAQSESEVQGLVACVHVAQTIRPGVMQNVADEQSESDRHEGPDMSCPASVIEPPSRAPPVPLPPVAPPELLRPPVPLVPPVPVVPALPVPPPWPPAPVPEQATSSSDARKTLLL